MGAFGLLGEHLGHSYSPRIHALMADYSYELFEVAPEQLDDFLKNGDFSGMNVTIPHRPGSLSRILNRINALGVNLTKLESRPLPDRDFEFMFYFDLEISVNAPEFLQLIAELEPLCESFHYLGSYSEVV